MSIRIIHQMANCMECGKIWEGYGDSKAQKAAYSHAKRTGHKVTGETGTGWQYN